MRSGRQYMGCSYLLKVCAIYDYDVCLFRMTYCIFTNLEQTLSLSTLCVVGADGVLAIGS